MSATAPKELLLQAGEPFAAGFMSAPQEPTFLRVCRGLESLLRHGRLPVYRGTRLYPTFSGAPHGEHGLSAPGEWPRTAPEALQWHYCLGMLYDRDRLLAKLEQTPDAPLRAALEAVDEQFCDYPRVGGWTHSIPNFGRLLAEGLGGYQARARVRQAEPLTAHDPEREVFYQGLLLVLDGLRGYCDRLTTRLASSPQPDPRAEANRRTLLAAYRQVPWRPARTFLEALVATNLLFYLDGSDDLGRFDQFMWPYYLQCRQAGQIAPEEAREWIGELWTHVDHAVGWNVALGGLKADGSSAANELTRLCLEAAGGRRRPNLALRVPPGMSEELWQAVFDCLQTGCGLPALYHELGYRRALHAAHLNLAAEDLADFAFGGCTETMIHGRSNVGSLEGDLNLAGVLEQALHRHLPGCEDFPAFLQAYRGELAAAIRAAVEQWNANQASKARHHPQPLRSLWVDDCLDNGREYNGGGARYNWCIVNLVGLANAADSLAALRRTVYEQQAVSRQGLLAALRADFAGHEALRGRLQSCPRYGNDDPYVDELAAEVSRCACEELGRYAPWRGGRYLGACLMFTTYAAFGKPVGATPDGRRAGEPMADSYGAYQGRDRSGPTALLRSVTRVPLELAAGTPVVNLRLSRKFFRGERRRKLRDLIETYFRLGGMQLQISVVDQATLEAAAADPERYADLIIRVGGFSEYWSRLDDDLRRAILERVEHE